MIGQLTTHRVAYDSGGGAYSTIVKTCLTLAATLIVSAPAFLLACNNAISGVSRCRKGLSPHCEADNIQAEGQTTIHRQREPLTASKQAGDERPLVDLANLAAEQGKNDALCEGQG